MGRLVLESFLPTVSLKKCGRTRQHSKSSTATWDPDTASQRSRDIPAAEERLAREPKGSVSVGGRDGTLWSGTSCGEGARTL